MDKGFRVVAVVFAVLLGISLVLQTKTCLAGEKVSGPDTDGDGILDYKECVVEDDGLRCEGQLDNCRVVPNSNQFVSELYVGDEDKQIGTACYYDLNNDGVVDVGDYSYLVDKVRAYQQSCFDSLNFVYRTTPECLPTNRVGDLTGGIDFFGNEYSPAGYLTHSDTCALLFRNQDIFFDVIVNLPISGCASWR